MPRTPSRDEIERRAYEIYEQRGCEEGHAEEDWFAAVRELTAQLASREHGEQEQSQSRIRTAVVQAMQQSKSRNARSSRN